MSPDVPAEVLALLRTKPSWRELRWELLPVTNPGSQPAPLVLAGGAFGPRGAEWTACLMSGAEHKLGNSRAGYSKHADLRVAVLDSIASRAHRVILEAEAEAKAVARMKRSEPRDAGLRRAAALQAHASDLYELAAAITAAWPETEAP